MKCPLDPEHGQMLGWSDKKPNPDGHDYYCPVAHGPFSEGLFVKEQWDGEKYVPTPSKPDKETIKEWQRLSSSPAADAGTPSSPVMSSESSPRASSAGP